MSGSGRSFPPFPGSPETLLHDWITIVQSELAALAADREARELYARMLAMWAEAVTRLMLAAPHADPATTGPEASGSGRRAGADAPARPAPAAAAPAAGQPEVERLHERIAQLEARIAELERGSGAARGGLRGNAGKRKAGNPARRPARGGPKA